MRTAKQLSQATLAETLGYSTFYLGRIERGLANVSKPVAVRCKRRLQSEMARFLAGNYHRAIDRRRYLASRHFYTSSELEEPATWLKDTKGRSSFYEDTLEGTLGEEKLSRMWEALS